MKMERIQLVSPAPGVQRFLQVFRLGPEKATRKIYIQAGLHADEWPGLLMLQHLIPKLEQLEAAGQLKARFVIVPFANPVGLSQQVFGLTTGRFSHENGQNFNRGMALSVDKIINRVEGRLTQDLAANIQRIREALVETVWEKPSDHELQGLHKTLLGLSIDADIVLDVHCDLESLAHLYCATVQKDEGMELARYLNFPVVMHEDILGTVAFDATHTQPWEVLRNRFPEFPINRPCFAATLELMGKSDVNDQLASQDAHGLLHYFTATKDITSQEYGPLETVNEPQSFGIDKVLSISSPCAGLLVYLYPLDTWLEAGTIFAEIVLIDSDEPNQRIPVKTPHAGYFFTRTHYRLVRPGTTVAMIGTAETVRPLGVQLAL